MGSALLNTADELEFAAREDNLAPALRAQVAERLAAHRNRRGTARVQAATEPVRPAAAAGRSAQIAAAVAERYARTPSYREVLAAEAERAIQQARAAAEVAAQNAQAIAAAQQRMLEAYDEDASREDAERRAAEDQRAAAREGARLDGFAERSEAYKADAAREQDLWPDLALGGEPATRIAMARAAKTMLVEESRTVNGPADSTTRAHPSATAARATAAVLTVRLYEEDVRGNVLSARPASIAARGRLREELGYDEGLSYRGRRSGYGDDRSDDEANALDEEIAFRQAPVFEEPAGPPVALPANLIEFPRHLVAARKARPRYAEGPLRDELEAAPGDGQLRIFEVDPAQISTSPANAEAQTAQWTSLWLDAPANSGHAAAAMDDVRALDEPPARPASALQPASIARRAAAGAINVAIVLCGLLAFAGVFMAIAGRGASNHAAGLIARLAGGAALAQAGLQLRSMATIGAVSAAFLMLLYHGLFFWFSTATPGMRSVRIALCTFEDENPTRRGVRRRMAATMLSSCSLGMGYAWAALDEERLTWHDRLSRMYLRRY